MDIRELIAISDGMDERKTDYGPMPIRSITFSEANMGLVLPLSLEGALAGSDKPIVLPMTDHALGQVSRKLGSILWPDGNRSLPIRFLKDMPPQYSAWCMNYVRTQASDDDGWTIRALDRTCRAVLSKDYSVVDNSSVLRMVCEAAKVIGPHVMDRHHLTENTLHLRIAFRGSDIGDDHVYQRGVFVRNGEIGNSSVSVWPWVKKISCENSFTWVNGGWSHIHVGNRRVIASEFTLHLTRALGSTGKFLNRLVSSHNIEIDEEYISRMMRAWRWTEKVRDQVTGAMEEWSVGGFANAVSLIAQEQSDEEDRLNMETRAGEIVWQ